jgi:hypothetical protein
MTSIFWSTVQNTALNSYVSLEKLPTKKGGTRFPLLSFLLLNPKVMHPVFSVSSLHFNLNRKYKYSWSHIFVVVKNKKKSDKESILHNLHLPWIHTISIRSSYKLVKLPIQGANYLKNYFQILAHWNCKLKPYIRNWGTTCLSHANLIALIPSSSAAGWIHIHNWRREELPLSSWMQWEGHGSPSIPDLSSALANGRHIYVTGPTIWECRLLTSQSWKEQLSHSCRFKHLYPILSVVNM